MTKTEELKQLLPNLRSKEIKIILDHLKNEGIDTDKIDFYACGRDTDFNILQGYLFQEYGIEIPEEKTDKEYKFKPIPQELCRKILSNDINILTGQSNSGKSMALYHLIISYLKQYKGIVRTFGIPVEQLTYIKKYANSNNIQPFNSLLELEQIKESIIIIEEFGTLLDTNDRQKKRQIEEILRVVNHKGNKILLCGLPHDFKKFITCKAKSIMFKTLKMNDLINGSDAKEILKQYQGVGKGVYSFHIDVSSLLLWDGMAFEVLDIPYYEKLDNKRKNVNLFV